MNSSQLSMAAQLNNKGVDLMMDMVSTGAVARQPAQASKSMGRHSRGALHQTRTPAVHLFRRCIQVLKPLLEQHHSTPDFADGGEPVVNNFPLSFVETHSTQEAAAGATQQGQQRQQQHTKESHESKQRAAGASPRTPERRKMDLQNAKVFSCIDCAIVFTSHDLQSTISKLPEGNRDIARKQLILVTSSAVMINVGILCHRLYSWRGLPSAKRDQYGKQAVCMYRNALKCLRSIHGHSASNPLVRNMQIVATNNLAVLNLARHDILNGSQRFAELRSLLSGSQRHTASTPVQTSASAIEHCEDNRNGTNDDISTTTTHALQPAWMKTALLNIILSRDISHFMIAAAAA